MKRYSLAVLATLLANVALADSDDVEFKIINRTSATIVAFYAAPHNVDNWEEDILASGVLDVGETGTITIADGRETCVYDFRAEFKDGEVLERDNINICELSSYTYTE